MSDQTKPDSMAELVADLVDRGLAARDTIEPCYRDEVEEIRAVKGAEHLPAQYEEFLLIMGRRAGELLRGSDFFYPSVVELDGEMRELLEECNASHLAPAGSIYIGMHQGGSLYWMAPGDPSGVVSEYIEFQEKPSRNWPSLLEFLSDAADEQLRTKEKYGL
ncbi:hypothetical protein [Saccharopolyspora sp. 6V]|uniref:hypothetical protein n=1 Tax=Saccharopolyspora sp. 6V TaxID=2877239 RepID=UPI001CD449B8|nr:hypothetical protein [Saccharopolyspora sp. 6V]MCA1195765.1 hypothetical protein [Saccharopolyspora sp. 6V]